MPPDKLTRLSLNDRASDFARKPMFDAPIISLGWACRGCAFFDWPHPSGDHCRFRRADNNHVRPCVVTGIIAESRERWLVERAALALEGETLNRVDDLNHTPKEGSQNV